MNADCNRFTSATQKKKLIERPATMHKHLKAMKPTPTVVMIVRTMPGEEKAGNVGGGGGEVEKGKPGSFKWKRTDLGETITWKKNSVQRYSSSSW